MPPQDCKYIVFLEHLECLESAMRLGQSEKGSPPPHTQVFFDCAVITELLENISDETVYWRAEMTHTIYICTYAYLSSSQLPLKHLT